jgi:hypothetical protein
MQSYLDQLDAITHAFEQGKSYELLVTNESMVPLFMPYTTHVRLAPVGLKIHYGTIVFYQRVSQSCSLRWINRVGKQSVVVRGLQQRHCERIPRSGIIAVVSAFEYKGQWVERSNLMGLWLIALHTSLGFCVRCYRHVLAALGLI